jgi:hypothetical protein
MHDAQLAHIASSPAEIELLVNIIDHIKRVVGQHIPPDSITFHPVKYAPSGTDNTFAIYRVIKNTDYDQPYIKYDNMRFKIYHPIYETTLLMQSSLHASLNNENVSDNSELTDLAALSGVKLLEVVCRVGEVGQSEFAEGDNRYNVDFDITLRYVIL